MKVLFLEMTLMGLLTITLGQVPDEIDAMKTLSCSISARNLNQEKTKFDMETSCYNLVKDHIKAELDASLTYIELGAHFLSSDNFRPGVAKLFLTHAGEERMHAKALIDYLTMRGVDDEGYASVEPISFQSNKNVTKGFESVSAALKLARDLEVTVRDAFKSIIKGCDDPSHENVDYHLSDFLTGEFLDEQHRGVKELTSLISILDRLLKESNNNAFAEFEFDRTLMKED